MDVIQAAIEEQPVTSYREIGRATGFSRETVRRRLIGRGYSSRLRRLDGLTAAQKERRFHLFTRLLNKLKRGIGGISFCDESWVDCGPFKGPRFRIITKNKRSAAAALEAAAGGRRPHGLMVWAYLDSEGYHQLIVCRRSVKINAISYLEDIIVPHLHFLRKVYGCRGGGGGGGGGKCHPGVRSWHSIAKYAAHATARTASALRC